MLELRQKGKDYYAQSDKVFEQLKQRVGIGSIISLEDGRQFEMVDVFAENDVQYGHGPVRRFTLQELKRRRS